MLLFRNFHVRSLQGIVVRPIQIPKQKGPDALGENLCLYHVRAKRVLVLKDNACFSFSLEMQPHPSSTWHLKSRSSGSASLFSGFTSV